MDGGGEEERIEGKRRKEASKRDAGERGPSPESRSWGLGELGGGTCRCLQLQDRARLSGCLCLAKRPTALWTQSCS